MLAGTAQWLSGAGTSTHRRQWTTRALATAVGLIALATLLEYFLGRDFGIDQWLFRDDLQAAQTPFPGRMSVIAIIEFVLFAAIVELRAWRLQAADRVAAWLALIGAGIGILALLGYTFGAHTLYAPFWNTSIALPTAVAFTVLFVGAMCARPDTGWMAVVAGERAGGVMLRRLAPFVILGPWVIGWLSVAGSNAGFYSANVDQVFVVGPLMFLSLVVLHQCAQALDRLDAEREDRKRDVEALNRELESRVQRRTEELLAANDQLRDKQLYVRSLIESSVDALATVDPGGNITDVNQQMEALTGSARPELIGTPFKRYFTDPARAEEGVHLVLRQGRVTDYELSARHRDGRETPVAYNASTYFDPQGILMGVFAAARDITERKRAEEQLRKQAEMLHLVPAAIVVRDREGKITFWSRGAADLYGWKGEEALGITTSALLQAQLPETLPQIEATVLRGMVWEGELRHTKRNGQQITVASRWALQRDPQGTPAGYLEINVDITERKRAEIELQRLNRALMALSRCTEAVARAMDESTLLQQVCDTIVQVGGLPLAWVGYAEDDKDRMVRPVAISGVGADYVRNARITWADNERGRGPTGTAIRTGRPCFIPDIVADPRFAPWREAAVHQGYASVMAVPLRNGEQSFGALNIYAPEPNAFDREERSLMLELATTLSHGILALRTREERDQAVIELRQLNETLERRVAERTAELAASNAELESFTYSVSHDLRAPLRHIDGFSKVLLEQYSEGLDATAMHYLERVRHATQHMGRLVDDLLNLSRIGRCALYVEHVALGDIVREVADELQADAGARTIEWQIAPLPVVACDARLIRQVFFNLLSNAAKFSRDRSPAVIEVGMCGSELFVRDNGVGFDPNYADKLFGVFQRLHRSEEFEGTGVGLATVRRILRNHGGDIRAEATPDAGATFYFTLGQPEAVSGVPESEAIHAA